MPRANAVKTFWAILIWLIIILIILFLSKRYVTDVETDIRSMRLSMLFEYLFIGFTGTFLFKVVRIWRNRQCLFFGNTVRLFLKGIVCVCTIVAVYFIFHLIQDTVILYLYSVAGTKKLDSSIYLHDRTRGYVQRRSIHAVINYPSGKQKSIVTDSVGMRVGERTGNTNAASILLLGCSYTFGDGLSYEESFAGYLQDSCHYSVLNAGVNGYGLAQMQYNLKQLLSEKHPGCVVVQCSPWLRIRAVNRFAPALTNSIAVPYFTLKADGDFKFNAPDFYSETVKFDFAKYTTDNPPSFSSRIWLYFQITIDYLPVAIHDYTCKLIYDFKFLLCINQHVLTKKSLLKMEEYVYRNIANQCKQAGVPMLVLAISDPLSETAVNFNNWQIPGIFVVNADSVLKTHLQPTKQYYETYGIYDRNGSDSVLIDYHPNTFAHKLIGQSIASVISRIDSINSYR